MISLSTPYSSPETKNIEKCRLPGSNGTFLLTKKTGFNLTFSVIATFSLLLHIFSTTLFSRSSAHLEILARNTLFDSKQLKVETIELSLPEEKKVFAYLASFNTTEKNSLRMKLVVSSEKTFVLSELARSSGAILAINGGYFSIQDGKIKTVGAIRCSGRLIENRIDHPGYQAVAISNTRNEIRIVKDLASAMRLPDDFDFMQSKPPLVSNGRARPSLSDPELTKQERKARTVIGIKKDGTVLFLVVEAGGGGPSVGLTQGELSFFLEKLGAENALNLDGGGSSAMWFAGRILNRLSGGLHPFTLPGTERPVTSAILLLPPEETGDGK